MTEDEAKTKWCPHVRQSNGYKEGFSKNRESSGAPTDARCIASECMAWRWIISPEKAPNASGYCGLAGRP